MWTKAGAVGAGLAIMIVGATSLFLSATYYNDCQSGVGQLAQKLNDTYAAQCEIAAFGLYGGGIVAVVGIVIAIVGGITAPTTLPPFAPYYQVQPQLLPPPPPPPPIQAGWLCANCRRLNASPTGAAIQFCQHCGTQHTFRPPPG